MVIQDYFNRAFIGLASQGFTRSTVSNAGVDDLVCALRGDGGARCSLGWLVDDADYTPALEYEDVRLSCALQRAIDADVVWDRVLIEFITFLQRCHDTSTGPYNMFCQMEALANDYRLEVPCV